MAKTSLAAQSAFAGLTPVKSAELTIEARDDLTMVSFAAAKGKVDAVRAAVRDACGVELPSTPERVAGKDIAFIWSGPDQWMAIAERGANDRDLETELKPLLASIAAVVDQSDGRAVVRIAGPRARDVLAKGVPVDLHPRAFKSNGVAITHASHIGIILWQVDATPTYEIAMFRSFADSFTSWLMHSAAEYTGH